MNGIERALYALDAAHAALAAALEAVNHAEVSALTLNTEDAWLAVDSLLTAKEVAESLVKDAEPLLDSAADADPMDVVD